MEESPIGHPHPDAGADAQRRDERDSLLVLARIRLVDALQGDSETVRVRNVSSGGLMAQTSADYRVGAAVLVDLDGTGTLRGSVAWAEAGRIGIAFDHPIDKARARKPKADKNTAASGVLLQTSPISDYRRPPVKPR